MIHVGEYITHVKMTPLLQRSAQVTQVPSYCYSCLFKVSDAEGLSLYSMSSLHELETYPNNNNKLYRSPHYFNGYHL
jgi:hypothetical protein